MLTMVVLVQPSQVARAHRLKLRKTATGRRPTQARCGDRSASPAGDTGQAALDNAAVVARSGLNTLIALWLLLGM